MAARSRIHNQHDWDPMRDDFNNSSYDPQYPDDDASDEVQLDHCRLYITNIPKGLNEEGLKAVFTNFGTLVQTYVSRDPLKRFALLKFESPSEAKLAMMKLDRTEPLKLKIFFAHKKNDASSARPRDHRERPNNAVRDQTYNRDDKASVDNTWRKTRPQGSQVNGENEIDDLPVLEDASLMDTMDSNLNMELETLKLEQLKIREEQLLCKHRMLLLKQTEKRSMQPNSASNRCILPDGRIVVRNAIDRCTESRATDVNFIAGAGDSLGNLGNIVHICVHERLRVEGFGTQFFSEVKEMPISIQGVCLQKDTTVCSCKTKTKCSWVPCCSDEGSSTPSTCTLCTEERSDLKAKSEFSKSKTEYSGKVVDSRSTRIGTKKSECGKAETLSKKSDATSKKFDVNYVRNETSRDLKFNDFYTDTDDEDETNRLIQLRNSDYMDIIEDNLKLVVALAGYPKSKMRLRQMELFQRCLHDVIEMQLKNGLLKKVPAFIDYYLNRGALVCICKDVDTRDWMVRVSPGLQERMSNNLVLLKAKVKRLCLAVLKIPRSCWPATAQDAFKLLQYFNPMLKTDSWKIYAQKVVDNVECTSFLIDRVSGEIIRGPSFKNVIDYDQMEFELTGYTEIYYECFLSSMEEDLSSVASRVKLLEELKSADATPRNASEVSVQTLENFAEVKETALNTVDVNDPETHETVGDDVDVTKELESSMRRDILNKLKDVTYISDKEEVLVWSEATINKYPSDHETENVDETANVDETKDVKDCYADETNNLTSTSCVAMSDKTESVIESNDNLIARNSSLNIDSNRGLAYHRRTNYLHVENELKVAITLEGYPQNKLEGTHIRRLKHLFKEYLHKDMRNQRFANLIIPTFQDVYLSNGAVIYICDSLETKDYLTEVLPKLINTTGLKLIFRDIKYLVRYTRVVMRLPKEHAHVESLEILLKLQSVYPGLKPDCWKYYSDIAGKQKRQFGVEPDSLEVIKSPDFDPTYEGEKLTFRIIDRKKRDVSFDECNTKDEPENADRIKCREAVFNSMFIPIDPEVMKAPLTRVRMNHYSHLIADDLKLYVGPANYPESRVDEAMFHCIKRTFENIVFEAVEKHDLQDIPKFHDMYLFDGVIFIICQNIYSRYWIEKIISTVNTKLNLELKPTEFRGAVGIISMVIKTDKSTDDVIKKLQEQNPRLRTKYWRKISTIRTNTKLDVVLQIDKQSAQVILNEDFNKYIENSAVEFNLGHLKSFIKPKLSLEELTKAHEKKSAVPSDVLPKKKNKMTKKPKIKNNKQCDDVIYTKEDPELKIEEYDRSFDHEIKVEASINEGVVSNKVAFSKLVNSDKSDLDPIIIEPDSPISKENYFSVPDHQQVNHKIILKIPLSILPDCKDDLNIIFDLLEHKNPGLDTELWRVYTQSEYPNNGKFTLYVDKQSLSIIKGKNFDLTIGGENLKFFY